MGNLFGGLRIFNAHETDRRMGRFMIGVGLCPFG